jgi:hypothetical protein
MSVSRASNKASHPPRAAGAVTLGTLRRSVLPLLVLPLPAAATARAVNAVRKRRSPEGRHSNDQATAASAQHIRTASRAALNAPAERHPRHDVGRAGRLDRGRQQHNKTIDGMERPPCCNRF